MASVALASAQTRVGDRPAAARAFAELMETWYATGQGPQLWTTARNAAALLLAEGRMREAVLLTIHAEGSPDAATVDEHIAAHSSRALVSTTDLLDAEQLATLRQEAQTMSVREVLDSARLALLELGGDVPRRRRSRKAVPLPGWRPAAELDGSGQTRLGSRPDRGKESWVASAIL